MNEEIPSSVPNSEAPELTENARLEELRAQYLERVKSTDPETLAAELAQETVLAEQINRELQELADHDALTGLWSRGGMDRQMDLRIREFQRSLKDGHATNLGSLLLLDLDDFKAVNDQISHPEGDRLLVAVARGLEEQVRPGDLVARLGGDEFLVYLENTDAEGAVLVAKRFRAAVQAAGASVLPDGWRPQTTSMGIADGRSILLHEQIQSPDQKEALIEMLKKPAARQDLFRLLYSQADAAQFQAKGNNDIRGQHDKNRIGLWTLDSTNQQRVVRIIASK